MIYCFICECGGVTNLMRRTLKSAGLDNWLDITLYRGKSKFKEFYDGLPEEQKGRLEIGALNQHLANVSSYAVILGIDGDRIVWSDIKSGDVKSRLDAEIIAAKFAQKSDL